MAILQGSGPLAVPIVVGGAPGLRGPAGESVDLEEVAAVAEEHAAEVITTNRATIPEAQVGVSTKLLSAAGGKAMLDALVRETPVRVPGGTVDTKLKDVLPTHALGFGAKTDGTDARTGLLAAFASGGPVTLGDGFYTVVADNLRSTNVPRGTKFTIEGKGSHKTFIEFSPELVDAQGIVFGNTEVVDLTKPIVKFPSTNGSTLVDERPTTTISAAVTAGSFTIPVGADDDFEAGDIIRIKTQRLDLRGETRNSIMDGETNQIISKALDVLTLRYPIASSYDPAVVYTGTATAGTSTSITLPGVAAGNYDVMPGCRIEITGGTGVGQVRYITSFDSATGVLKIDGEAGTYGQDVFSPVPDNTSVVSVTRTPYVFHAQALGGLSLKGVTVVCSENIPQGISIRGVDSPYLEDVRVIGATEAGIIFSGCIAPRGRDLKVKGANDGSEGYTVVVKECRDCRFESIDSEDNRRGATDCSGTTPTWGCDVNGFSTVGGVKDADGLFFTAEDLDGPTETDYPNYNYGCGEHGQARDFVYRNGVVEGVTVGCVARGNNTRFENIRISGPVARHYWWSDGLNLTIEGARYYGRNDAAVVPQPAVPGNEGHFLYLTGSRARGRAVIEGSRLSGLQGSFIYCSVNTNLSLYTIRERVSAQIVARDNRIGFKSPNAVAVFDGNDNYAINGWDVEAPIMTFDGTGSFEVNRRLVVQASVAGQSVWFKYGNHYRISVAYQSTVSIPFPIGGTAAASATQVGVELFPANNNNQVRGSGYMRSGNTTVWAPYATNIGSTAIAVIGSVPTGTSGAANNVTLHHTGGGTGRFVLENQMQVGGSPTELNAELRLSQSV